MPNEFGGGSTITMVAPKAILQRNNDPIMGSQPSELTNTPPINNAIGDVSSASQTRLVAKLSEQ